MISKTKSKDINSLIIKVKNMAKELINKKSKQQRKRKSGNETLQYTDLDRREKILIGGNNVKVKLDNETKKDITEELKSIGYLVHLLKATTVQKIYQKIIDTKRTEISDEEYLKFRSEGIKIVEKLTPQKNGIYNFKIFVDESEDTENIYNKYEIEKEITMLNIVILFYNSLAMDNDDQDVTFDKELYQNMIEEYYNNYNFEQEGIRETVEGFNKQRTNDTDIDFFEKRIEEIKETKKEKLKEYYEKIENENEAMHKQTETITDYDFEEIKKADKEINELYKQLNTLLKKEEANVVFSYNPLTTQIKFTPKISNRIDSANQNVPNVKTKIQEITTMFTDINELLKQFDKRFSNYKSTVNKDDILRKKEPLIKFITEQIKEIEALLDQLIIKCTSLRPSKSTSTSTQRVKKEEGKKEGKKEEEEEEEEEEDAGIYEDDDKDDDEDDEKDEIAKVTNPIIPLEQPLKSGDGTYRPTTGRIVVQVSPNIVAPPDPEYSRIENVMNQQLLYHFENLTDEYNKTMKEIYELFTDTILDRYIKVKYTQNVETTKINDNISLQNHSIEVTLRDTVKTSVSYLDKQDTVFKQHIDEYMTEFLNKIRLINTTYNQYFTFPRYILDKTNKSILTPEYYDVKKIEAIDSFKKIIKDLVKTIALIKSSFNEMVVMPPLVGGKRSNANAKYKSTGQVVYILYKKRKYKRIIYVKDKGITKYCKIDNEYVLLSKLKVIV